MKIGVFVCHCGSNIEATVDTATVAKIALTYPDVVFSEDTMYTCSEPGQENIVQAIKKHGLDGVVVASCSPRMHEPTFRRTVERAGLNRYMFEMANMSTFRGLAATAKPTPTRPPNWCALPWKSCAATPPSTPSSST